MLRKIGIALCLFLSTSAIAYGDELTAKINSSDFVPLNRSLLLEANDSLIGNPSEFGEAQYWWNFHDGKGIKKGKEIIYTFHKLGKNKVTLSVSQGQKESTVEKFIVAYRSRALLITDEQIAKGIKGIQDEAGENGTWLKTIALPSSENNFLNEEKLSQKLSELHEFINKTDIFIFYSKNIDSLDVFTRYYQNLKTEYTFPLKNKFFVQISQGNFKIIQ
ncbi:MAG TPA: hypothetical protein PLQ36_04135, partial [Candidatus Gracilibacteria bacterium]|nr:hypothetical protein [Candidatus Gracilibacteria bacterium]